MNPACTLCLSVPCSTCAALRAALVEHEALPPVGAELMFPSDDLMAGLGSAPGGGKHPRDDVTQPSFPGEGLPSLGLSGNIRPTEANMDIVVTAPWNQNPCFQSKPRLQRVPTTTPRIK